MNKEDKKGAIIVGGGFIIYIVVGIGIILLATCLGFELINTTGDLFINTVDILRPK